MEEKLYTRKEVIALLKRQIKASYNSYEKFPVSMSLATGFQAIEYVDDLHANAKRLKKVRVIKF